MSFKKVNQKSCEAKNRGLKQSRYPHQGAAGSCVCHSKK